MDPIIIVLIAVIGVLYLTLHIIWGIYCARESARKGYGTKKNFWLGFFLGLIAVVIVAIRPPKTYILNPNIKNELMQLAWMRQVGALTDVEYEREKKVLLWMNEYMS